MKFLMQFPTAFRPKKFMECLGVYLNSYSGNHHLHFNIVCDIDDESMNNSEVVSGIHSAFEGKQNTSFDLYFDKDTNKISAINSHINEIVDKYDIVYCVSDDMIPQVNDWDEIIAKAMQENFPDLDGCVHINTGDRDFWTDWTEVITLSILGRELYKEFGYIYHPSYKSFYCDDEFSAIMHMKNKIFRIDEKIVRHEHCQHKNNRNSGTIDKGVEVNNKNWFIDQATFEKRKSQGFPR